MIRVVICLLIALATSSFKFKEVGPEPLRGSLLSKIEKARELVKAEQVQLIKGMVGTRKVRVSRRKFQIVPVEGITGREMALAIMTATGEIEIARAIKRDKEFEVLTPGFVISVRRENGINTDFSCLLPAGGRVLAVKYPVSNEGNRFGSSESVIEAVYTPYSAEIKTEEVVEKGIDVQKEFIRKAYSRLKERGVLSHAFEGRRVADVVPVDVVQVLLMNEHIDPSEFKTAGLTRALVERVLTVVGTNREKAYAYSVSSAGARGLVQMIPSTYSLIANKYQSAGLMRDFAKGMADPVNAIMAQVLLCDADWQSIRTRRDIPGERIGPYLAAAYNGGVGRVMTILGDDEMDWMEEPDETRRPTKMVQERVAVRVRPRKGRAKTVYVTKSYTVPIFRSETSKYVSQYHWINGYFLSRGEKGVKPKA